MGKGGRRKGGGGKRGGADKKKKGGRGAAGGNDNDDDAASVGVLDDWRFDDAASSAGSAEDDDASAELRAEERIMTGLDLLSEKRASSRERGLADIVTAMLRHNCADVISSQRETLLNALLLAARKGAKKEASLACLALAVLAITIGAGDDELYSEASWGKEDPWAVCFQRPMRIYCVGIVSSVSFLPRLICTPPYLCLPTCASSSLVHLRSSPAPVQIEPVLLRVIHQGKGGAAASLTALGMVCFVASTKDSDGTQCISEFEKSLLATMAIGGGKGASGKTEWTGMGGVETAAKVKSVSAKGRAEARDVLVAACSGWGLVASTLGSEWLAGRGQRKYLPLFRYLIDHDSLAVRVAAGDNIALICEATGGLVASISAAVAGTDSSGGDATGAGGAGAAAEATGPTEEDLEMLRRRVSSASDWLLETDAQDGEEDEEGDDAGTGEDDEGKDGDGKAAVGGGDDKDSGKPGGEGVLAEAVAVSDEEEAKGPPADPDAAAEEPKAEPEAVAAVPAPYAGFREVEDDEDSDAEAQSTMATVGGKAL